MCDYDKQYNAWTEEIGTLNLTYSVPEATRLNRDGAYSGVAFIITKLSNPGESLYYEWDWDTWNFVPMEDGHEL